MLKDIINKDEPVSLYNLDDLEVWKSKLGSYYTSNKETYASKGEKMLISFIRLIDGNTLRILKVREDYKRDAYSVCKWLLQNFHYLINKDNLDINNKRIRLAEYVVHYLAKKINSIIIRIQKLNEKDLSMDKIKEIFSINKFELIRQLMKGNLIQYDDSVNDLDIFTSLKYTMKGPNAIGEHNSKSIQKKYRGIYPNHIGKLDINTASSSDPGMTGIFTPFSDIDGYYFNNDPEPQFWVRNIKKLKTDYIQEHGLYKSIDLLDENAIYNEDGSKELAVNKDELDELIVYSTDDKHVFVPIDRGYNKNTKIRIRKKKGIRAFTNIKK